MLIYKVVIPGVCWEFIKFVMSTKNDINRYNLKINALCITCSCWLEKEKCCYASIADRIDQILTCLYSLICITICKM